MAGKVYNPLRASGKKVGTLYGKPVSVIKDYDAACNAHDVEGVMALFTDDEVVRLEPSPPDVFGGVYTGKEQIRAGYVEPLMAGFRVEASDYQVVGRQEGVGQRVSWTASVSGDFFRQMGAESPVEANAEAVVEGDKLKSFTAINPGLREAPRTS